MDRGRFDFPTTLARIARMAFAVRAEFKNVPIVVGIESNAYQAAVPQSLKSRPKDFPFPIKAIKTSQSKFLRISQFAVHVENGTYLLRQGDKDQQAIYDEMVVYPTSEFDDAVDMAAMGTDLLLGMVGKSKIGDFWVPASGN